MAERVYIETTVVSYLTVRPSRDLIVAGHQHPDRKVVLKQGIQSADHLYPGRNDGGKAMSWSDPIVDEVRQARDAYATRFNYDLRAIYRDLKEEKEKRSGRAVVSYAEGARPNEALQPTGAATSNSANSKAPEAAPATEH